MGLEIERKFLVNGNVVDFGNIFVEIHQGYLNSDPDKTVRVRLDVTTWQAYITVKGRNNGCVRMEFEYGIPYNDAYEMLQLCDNVIKKTRYYVDTNGVVLEVDVFSGNNEGLIVAEVEFDSPDHPFRWLSEERLKHYLPKWVGKEVTDDPQYYNSSLINHPYNTW